MFTLLVMYISFGLILCALAIPLIRNKVKPNMFYGFRVARTLKNPRIWYAVNQHAGIRLLISGVIAVVAAVGLYFVPGMTVDGYAMLVLVLVMGSSAIGLIQSWRYLRSLPDE